MAYGSVLGRNTKPQFVPTFAITGPLPGNTVTVSYGGTTVEAVEDNGTWYAKAWAYGTYTVSVGSKSTTVNVDEVKLYEVVLKSPLNDSSWEVIKKVADAGQASNYWEVGDTKAVVLNGTVQGYTFNNFTVNVFIIGIDHNSELEGTNKIHFQIGRTASGTDIAFCDSNYGVGGPSQGFRMNVSQTNSGGWYNSYSRLRLLGRYGTSTSPYENSFMTVLPSDLRTAMKFVTKYTDNTGNASNSSDAVTSTSDYLFLLSEFEVQGVRTYANQYEQNYQMQYDYYKAGNSKIKYRHDSTDTAVFHWCRSAVYTNNTFFCVVNAGGGASSNNAYVSFGVAPGFCV